VLRACGKLRPWASPPNTWLVGSWDAASCRRIFCGAPGVPSVLRQAEAGEHEAEGGGGWVSVRFRSPLRFVVCRQSCPRFPEF